MKKHNYIKYILTLISLAGMTISCSDLLDQDPEDRLVVGNFYKTEAEAQAAVNGVYDRLQNGMYERTLSMLTDLVTDDMKNGLGMSNADLQDLEFLRHSSENSFVRAIWQQCYDGIARANTAIQALPGVSMNEERKNQYIGEVRFLRGLFYFNLVRLYGDVPLLRKLESLEDAYKPRSPIADVYALIVEDLAFAENNLPATYQSKDIGRATSGAAKILLGKVYLTREQWQLAADKLEEVIDDAGVYGYALHDNFRDNWEVATENGSEMVFSVQFAEPPSNGNQLMQAIAPNYSMPGGGIPGVTQHWEADIPTEDLFSIFDDADERKAASFNKDYVSPKDGLIYSSTIENFYKYWEQGEKFCANSDINFHVLRYADAILMYAEALNELNLTTDAETQINVIRERAFNDDAHNYNGLDKVTLRDMIRHERRLEFTHEAQRFFDLARWGTYIDVMIAHSAAEPQKEDIAINISSRNMLFPIPQRERDLNPKLEQNTGF